MRRKFSLAAGLEDRSGAGALEFALVMPFFMLMLYAVFDLGAALYSGAEVGHAVAKAARGLVVDPTMTSAELQAAVQAATPDIPAQAIAVSVSKKWVTSDAQVAQVTWTYSYSTGLPFVPKNTLNFGSTLLVPMAT